ATGAPAWRAGRRASLRARLARAPHPPTGARSRARRGERGSLAEPSALTATTARHDVAPVACAAGGRRRHGVRGRVGARLTERRRAEDRPEPRPAGASAI